MNKERDVRALGNSQVISFELRECPLYVMQVVLVNKQIMGLKMEDEQFTKS